MSELVRGRGGVLLGPKNTQELQIRELSRPAQLFQQALLGFFFLLLYFESTLVAAKMTTAVVSPFFDFEVMNKVR